MLRDCYYNTPLCDSIAKTKETSLLFYRIIVFSKLSKKFETLHKFSILFLHRQKSNITVIPLKLLGKSVFSRSNRCY